MNTDLAKRTILPAYIKYQDDLNADFKLINKDKKDPFNFIIELAE